MICHFCRKCLRTNYVLQLKFLRFRIFCTFDFSQKPFNANTPYKKIGIGEHRILRVVRFKDFTCLLSDTRVAWKCAANRFIYFSIATKLGVAEILHQKSVLITHESLKLPLNKRVRKRRRAIYTSVLTCKFTSYNQK